MGDGVPEDKPYTQALPLYFMPCSFTEQQFGWEHGCNDAQQNVGPRAVSADGSGALRPWQGPARGWGLATTPKYASGPRGCAA